MLEAREDQATGLRQMMPRTALRVLPLVTGMRGVGHTATTVNLAAALAKSGQRIVVLDAGRALIASALNLKARYELLHLLTGEKSIDETLLEADSFDVLPATKGVEEFIASGGAVDDLFSAFTSLGQPYNLAIIAGPGIAAAALTPVDAEIVFVTNDSNESIKSTYAELKKLAGEYGRQRFRIIFNDTEDAHHAQDAYARLADTSQKFLHAELALGGIIPRDPAIRRATAACSHVFSADPCPVQQIYSVIAADLDGWYLAEFSGIST